MFKQFLAIAVVALPLAAATKPAPVTLESVIKNVQAQQKKTQKITRLKAGETATLVFEDLVPATGSEKENIMKVTAGPVPGEKKTDNNVMELDFIMRAETG